MRAAVILCLFLLGGALFWMFPLFHIVPLDVVKAAEQNDFNASSFVATFWEDRLLPSLDAAVDAETLHAAMDENPRLALKRFGRKAGVGRTTLLLVRGSGTVANVDAEGVAVSLTPDSSTPDIVLRTGLLFGNAARDATGLLDSGDFENSLQFNAISTELNRRIEAQVIPTLKETASIGRPIRFIGCAEVPDNIKSARPLTLIPLVVSSQ